MIDAAKFDRRITIKRNESTTKDSFGEPENIWVTYAEVWAAYNKKVERRQNKEEFQASQLVAEGKDSFEIRYLTGLDETMLIIFDLEVYDIISIKEQGRRKTLLIEAKKKDRKTFSGAGLESTLFYDSLLALNSGQQLKVIQNRVTEYTEGTWSAQSYDGFDKVRHNLLLYIAAEDTISTDVPGVSAKWRRATEFNCIIPHPTLSNKYYRYSLGHAKDDYVRIWDINLIDLTTEDFAADPASGNYDSMTDTNAPADPDDITGFGNRYANLGGTITVTFTGGKVFLNHIKDNRGLKWSFEYVSGVDSENPPANVEIDTYNATITGNNTTEIFSGLTYGEHTIKGTAILNTQGSNQRAWFTIDTGSIKTFAFKYENPVFNSHVQGINSGSNLEFAIRARLNSEAGDSMPWFPEHDGIATCFNSSKKFYVDDVEYSDFSEYDKGLYNADELRLEQVGQFIHPDRPSNPFANYSSTHKITNAGIYYTITIDFLEELYAAIGYISMLPVHENFLRRIKAENGIKYSYDPSGGDIDLNEHVNENNFCFYHDGESETNGEGDHLFALKLVKGWRNGSSVFIQNRTNDGKLYPTVFENEVIEAGEQLVIEVYLLFSAFENAIDNIDNL